MPRKQSFLIAATDHVNFFHLHENKKLQLTLNNLDISETLKKSGLLNNLNV